jgi:predicted DNA binding CopG/RHH family protein
MVLERDRRLTIRLSDEELAMVAALAEVDGVSQSDYLRLFIRRAHAEKFGDKKPKKR